MNYEYYEIIAAKLFGIEPEKLFLKSRKEEIKNARFFCMTYRHDLLKLSLRVSGEKYSKDHCSVLHSNKTINNWIETKDKFGLMYLDFLEKCKLKEHQIQIKLQQEKKQLLKTIESIGWINYIGTFKEPFDNLIKSISNDDNEDVIREHIKIADDKLNELKYLYIIEEDEQKL